MSIRYLRKELDKYPSDLREIVEALIDEHLVTKAISEDGGTRPEEWDVAEELIERFGDD